MTHSQHPDDLEDQQQEDELLPRATRDYHPPTLLVPPPSGSLPDEPRALRSVWIEPEVTVVKPRARLTDYTSAAARARRATQARHEAQALLGQSDAPWSTNSGSEPPQGAGRAKLAWVALGAGIVLGVAALFLVFMPQKGGMLITAAGPGNTPIARAEVLVDGRPVCSSVPCRVEALPRGSHLVRIQADGYERTADQAVAVRAGEDSVIHLDLASSNNAGLELSVGQAQGLRVTLDGIDRGVAPLSLRGLSPGAHSLRIHGNPAYAPFEQQLQLEPGQLTHLSPKLVPLKAILDLTAGPTSLGARVEIVGGGVRHDIRELPARVELSPANSYHLRAIRAGYRDYETEVSFADGTLEKSVAIDLAWDAAAANKIDLDAPSASTAATSGAMGILGANSIPISNVLVDGRPVGKTPVQIPIAAGKHSVVFVHPSLGRKSVNLGVSSGKTAVAAVRF